MAHCTRHSVLRLGDVVATAASASQRILAARPRVLDQPPGLQLWTVKQELARDFDGTLGRLKSLGYARVAGWLVEQKPPFATSPLVALGRSLGYLKGLRV